MHNPGAALAVADGLPAAGPSQGGRPLWGKDAEGVLGGSSLPAAGPSQGGRPLWGKDAEGVLGGSSLPAAGPSQGGRPLWGKDAAGVLGGSKLIYADAGVASPKLARFAALHGCAEAEFLAGVPGTVGGALAMNAGCYGGETWRYVARVEVATRDGRFVVHEPSDYTIGYRSVRRSDGSPPDGIFTAAWFRFPVGDATAARARIKELLARRIATQPLSLPNAGSVFRNPEGDHAARLIEACGLKGHAIGDARVSEKHANFIVNPDGKAKAADIEALIAFVRATVLAQAGVNLEPEVRVVGEPT